MGILVRDALPPPLHVHLSVVSDNLDVLDRICELCDDVFERAEQAGIQNGAAADEETDIDFQLTLLEQIAE